MKGKKMTLEDLAAMTQQGFADLQEHVATKEDIESLATKDELRETREVLSRAIEDLALKLAAYAATVREDYERLNGRLMELEERVRFLESGRKRRA